MGRKRTWPWLLAMLVVPVAAQSASFDCEKAKSVNEKTICHDVQLSRLDEDMAVLYKDAIAHAQAPKELIANQRAAWRQREAHCSSKSCLLEWYEERASYFAVVRASLGAGEKTVTGKSATRTAEPWPRNVTKTWSYKPFSILSSQLGTEMSDAYIASKLMCKSPADTLEDTGELFKNYDLVGTSKTDGSASITSFRGVQQGKKVTVALAVDEQSRPRIERFVLVDGMPALSCN